MAVRSICTCRGSCHLFSSSSSENKAPIWLEVTPRRDLSRSISIRSVSAGDQHVSGVSTGARGSEEASVLSSSTTSAIDFLTLCRSLKTTKRKGWINHEIREPESVADHMYRMSLMALICRDLPGVNRERCIKIAIVHDIAEAIVGDITPSDNVSKAEKNRLEKAALDEICKVLGGGIRADEIQELWEEYENNSSLEANLIKDFDKVEMILQALEYETDEFYDIDISSGAHKYFEHGKTLDEFFLSTAGKFQTEIGRSWAAEIASRRKLTEKVN